jgi:hypothetical protein
MYIRNSTSKAIKLLNSCLNANMARLFGHRSSVPSIKEKVATGIIADNHIVILSLMEARISSGFFQIISTSSP